MVDAVVDSVATLNAEETLALRRIEQRAVWRAGIAGALSAGVTVAAMLLLRDIEASQPWGYWTWVLGVGALAAAVEIGFLYWDTLRSVRQMARAAGMKLVDGQEQDFVVLALARAALELPSPRRNQLRVDPLRETSRTAVLLATLVYKSKIALSSFLLKALLSRALGRLAARAALELVAVPVTAVWNMFVSRKVLREARLRVMGPSLASTLAQWVQEPLREQEPSPENEPWQEHGVPAAVAQTEGTHGGAIHGGAVHGAAVHGDTAPQPATPNGDESVPARRTRAALKGERMAARQHHVREVEQQPRVDAPCVPGRTLALWAIGTAFVKNRKVHPNVQALVRAMGQNEQVAEAPDLGDCPRFLRALKAAPARGRSAALRALVASSILDGKMTRFEREWLEVVFTVVGQQAPLAALKVACARFAGGQAFDPAAFPEL